MWAIAQSTFKEVYRKRIVHIVGILTLLYWALLGFILSQQPRGFGEEASLIAALVNISSMMSILGFYLSSMLLAFLTVMLTVGVISSEVEDGTVLTLLTKPIPRYAYVVGKFIGVSLMIIIYGCVLYIAIIIFASIGQPKFIEIFGVWTLMKGLGLFLLQPIAIASLAVFGSTFFKTVNNSIFVIAVYLLGFIGNIMEQIGAFGNMPDLVTYGILTSLIAPFEVIYRKMLSIVFADLGGFNMVMGMTGGNSVEPSGYMMGYVVIYMTVLIFLGIRKMNRRDIG